jgi:hypothetical protein
MSFLENCSPAISDDLDFETVMCMTGYDAAASGLGSCTHHLGRPKRSEGQ